VEHAFANPGFLPKLPPGWPEFGASSSGVVDASLVEVAQLVGTENRSLEDVFEAIAVGERWPSNQSHVVAS
jgi:hypothetical protein